jgi:Conserved hypothetical protein (DUF2461).
MWGIRFNNEKAWFEAHKKTYLDSLYKPMRELGDELYDHLSGQLKDYGLISRVSRIYRDARRLHGRGPYKDHLWISVEQPGDLWTARPCFWFELGPEEWSYGLGYYMAEPVTMARLRARMERDPAAMEKLTRALGRQDEFFLAGQEYKKPKPGAPSALLEPWFRKKNFALEHDEKLTEEIFSRQIAERVKTGCDFLLPYYRYFVTLDGDPDPRDA